jgi:hypothetical protein
MNKKYAPYIIMLVAGLLLFYIKRNQRGKKELPPTEQRSKVNVAEPSSNVQNENDPIDRTPDKIIYTKHARCRMECRHIDEVEVQEVLTHGTINYNKIEKDDRGKTFPLEGVTHDKQHVRIVFAPKKENLVVVTVIDLERDWPCNCK